MYGLTTQCYWLLPSQQSTCQLAHASLKAIRFQTGQKFTNRDLLMYNVLNLLLGFSTLLSNELAEQATLKEKNTEYKRTSKDEHRQLLVSSSQIIPAEPKLQS